MDKKQSCEPIISKKLSRNFWSSENHNGSREAVRLCRPSWCFHGAPRWKSCRRGREQYEQREHAGRRACRRCGFKCVNPTRLRYPSWSYRLHTQFGRVMECSAIYPHGLSCYTCLPGVCTHALCSCFVCVRMHVCMCASVHACMCACVCACANMCACASSCVYVLNHAHACAHTCSFRAYCHTSTGAPLTCVTTCPRECSRTTPAPDP